MKTKTKTKTKTFVLSEETIEAIEYATTSAITETKAKNEQEIESFFLTEGFRRAKIEKNTIEELADFTQNQQLKVLLTSVAELIGQKKVSAQFESLKHENIKTSNSHPAIAEYFEVERYQLLKLLGKGGMGEVWLARDAVLKRNVALKVLRSDRNQSKQDLSRFIHEARATGRLAHPGVIPVHDAGELGDGRWFYTMELLPGLSLADALMQKSKKVFSSHLQVLRQVCQTMAYAHAHGFIHRDLKPDNILLGEYGEVYVADWGLARSFDEELSRTSDIKSPDVAKGTIIGTLFYMSPEQVKGETDTLRPASDVWALGAMLFELLTGRPPFVARTAVQLIYKIIHDIVQDPRDVNEEREIPWKLAQLALEALDRDPKKRPNARNMAERIGGFLEGIEEQRRKKMLAKETFKSAKAEMIELHRDDIRYHKLRRALERNNKNFAEKTLSEQPITVSSFQLKHARWKREQQMEDFRFDIERRFNRAILLTTQSLGYAITERANGLAADLYFRKYEEAKLRRDETNMEFFRALVLRYDRERYADLLSNVGTLTYDVPKGALCVLFRQQPFGPILRSVEVSFEGSGATLQIGSYLLEVYNEGFLTGRYPFVIQGNQLHHVRARMLPSFPEEEAFRHITSGTSWFGGDPSAPEALIREKKEINDVLMKRDLVTIAEYISFLNDIVSLKGHEKAKKRAPRSSDGSHIWLDFDEKNNTFAVPKADRDGDAWNSAWPVTMVSWKDAVAYCAWISEKNGIKYRLPTEFEWERAARGADERFFPWGNGFDPSLCAMVDSLKMKTPVPVGTFVHDCSIFDIRDLAGMAMEWTSTPDSNHHGRYIQRGGGIFSPAAWCRAASRKSYQMDQVATQFGFRIVREI